MANITKIEKRNSAIPQALRVAAYARVSMDSERLEHSLSAQISYYSGLIQKTPGWLYAGVYADDAVSGTGTAKRDEFNRLLEDCEAGKIDIILVKSISRFARNTVDLLKTVRRLKELGISVRFEKEHIDSLSEDGELMLTLLASFAQEESRSISENVKWGTVERFKKGIPNGKFSIYGYRWEGDHLVIQPDEAEVVRFIFREYMNGKSRIEIGRELMAKGIYSKEGKEWVDSNVKCILTNIHYTGNLLFQKEYTVDPISKKTRKNRGELPQYFVEDTHEAIIPMAEFQAVQAEFKRRRDLGVFGNKALNLSALSTKITCGICGKHYRHSGKRNTAGDVYYIWTCQTKSQKGASVCPSKNIPEKVLQKTLAEVLGLPEYDEMVFSEQVNEIVVVDEETLLIRFYDGHEVTTKWQSTARVDCWSDERRQAWSELHKKKETNPNKRNCSEFTGFLRCGKCGENYRRQSHRYKDGTTGYTWYASCRSSDCGNTPIADETLKQLTAEVLGLSRFSEKVMDRLLSYAAIDNFEITFFFKDGHTESRSYQQPKKKGIPWTAERYELMSKKMRESWTPERRQEMSERMKKTRSEKYWSSKKKEK